MRIKELTIYTSGLNDLKEFYSDKIGIRMSRESENSFALQTLSTMITFNVSEHIQDPFYHFAFNIPEDQFKEAKEWTKKRVELIKLNGEDEFDFKSWNAHSIYFYDPAGNIIELIARHNLKNNTQEIFSDKSLLNVSEIGCPVHDVKDFYDVLKNKFNVPEFSGDMKTFTAAGDDEGLFIIVPDGRKWFPDCPDAKIFPMTVKIDSNKIEELEFEDLPYKIFS
ncbi:MAG: ring-cleaving dioxygenase [Ignavibacteria bacterium]